jgi:hypothetical protein
VNGTAVFAALCLLGAVNNGAGASPTYAVADTSCCEVPALRKPDGRAITNIYPYDARGRALHNVRLYDQDGNPILVSPSVDQFGVPIEHEDVIGPDGAPVENAFPQKQTRLVYPPTGAPPVSVPLSPPRVVVPALPPSTTTTTTTTPPTAKPGATPTTVPRR